jgi:formyl-CoA transferase
MIGCPVRLSDSPFETSAAPLMGEHTEDVLTSIAGYTAEEVRELHNKGVI